MNRKSLYVPVLSVISAALAACGGSSESTTVIPPVTSTTINTIVVGTITGFGSVYINGKKYEVDNQTVVSIEGEPDVMGDDSVLAVGMKVKVKASDDNSNLTATAISYDEDIKGTIDVIELDSANPAIGTIQVMGQTIIIDDSTVFDDDIDNADADPVIDIRDLLVGMTVEISGYPTEDGFIATYIDRDVDDNGNDHELGDPDTDDDEFELKGTVEAVADDLTSITVNGVVFIIDDATMLDQGIVLGQDLIGTYVEVEADYVNDSYIARKVELEDFFDDDDDIDEVEIKGILQAIDADASPATITINGQTIPVTSVDPFDGLVGTMIEVEGVLNDDGVLVVDEVELEEQPVFKVEDTITEVNSDEGSFTTRLGVVISVAEGAQFEDETTEDSDHLTAEQFLASLMTGDLIKASAFENSDGTLVWSKIKRLEQAANIEAASCEIEGAVAEITGGSADFTVTIQGVLVNSASVPEGGFENQSGVSMSRAEFFNQLTVGAYLSAESFEGDLYCTVEGLEAREIEFDD